MFEIVELPAKRKRTSRFVTVDGYQVQKLNMYTLQQGEPSVWDTELGNPQEDDENAPEAMPLKPFVKKVAKKEKRQMTVSETTSARYLHNNAVKADIEMGVLRRQDFIRSHWKLLAPFLDGASCPSLTLNTSHRRSFTTLKTQPICLQNVEMREYQLAGVNWLIKMYENSVNAILADEMGLGKTLQTIAFLGWMKFTQGINGPFFIIVPLSVFSNWVNEFRRFLPQMRLLKIHSSDARELERLRKEVLTDFVNTYDVVITTYEMVKAQSMKHILVNSIYWRYVVLDEGHVIRHEETQIASVVRHLHYEQVLLITGTPIQNNLHELYSLLNFLQPDVFQSSERFDDCFDIKVANKHRVDKELLMKVHHLLKPFMLRRIKSEVEKSVPPKVEKKILCPLTSTQTFWYKRFLLKNSNLLAELEEQHRDKDSTEDETEGERSRWKRLLSLYMQLRKVCNHPFLFSEADPDPGFTDERIIEASGKLTMMDRLLRKLQKAGHRVVIFSQFTAVLDIIGDYLDYRGFEFSRLDGSTNRVQRQVRINSFNAKNSPVFAFIMSTRAGGLGVNLQTADTVILFDSDWNPQADLQAMARVHRIGQTKVVHVYRLVTAGTVEERLVQRAEKKLYLDQVVNRDGLRENIAAPEALVASASSEDLTSIESNEDNESGLNEAELLEMLRFGADVVCESAEGVSVSDRELDELISREPAGVKKEGRSTAKFSALHFDPTAVSTEARVFQGTYHGKCSEGDSAESATQQTKRVAKSTLVTVRSEGMEFHIRKENMYDMETGGSVFQSALDEKSAELARKAMSDVKRKFLKAGRDYVNEDHCLWCWDGGDLLLCDGCPGAYHMGCLGITRHDVGNKSWRCPHHKCMECDRGASAVGGLLFRCSECPNAYCEDHTPSDAAINGRCFRMEKGGFQLPNQACYIYCSPTCAAWADKMLTVKGGVAPRCNTAAALKETSFAEMKVRKNSTVYVKCQAWSDYSKHWPYPYKLQDCYFKATCTHVDEKSGSIKLSMDAFTCGFTQNMTWFLKNCVLKAPDRVIYKKEYAQFEGA